LCRIQVNRFRKFFRSTGSENFTSKAVFDNGIAEVNVGGVTSAINGTEKLSKKKPVALDEV